ncbi:MAG TPA: ectonucleotide pyrophosphatase/phosphodiesterase [Gemmatimonadaceae bacterium]|nr:ectonucleotide pyrophosphatase/phosphodiesterase [Gemmatimonadaceae bacterium]
MSRRAAAGRLATILATGAAVVVAACVSTPGAPAPALPQRVLLVSLDGFRWDYLDRPGAVRLRQLAARGVRAERMVPAFPSKTFPNHYTIVTGLYPEHNGVVANHMIDPVLGEFGMGDSPSVRDARWWLGEPIWVTAEKQGVHAAPYLWPGVEAPIEGVLSKWYVKFDGTKSRADRVRDALAYLAIPGDTAPRFVTDYFNDLDNEGHHYGPASPQVDSAIVKVDSAVGALVDGIARLGLADRVNIIVVADHGMAPLSRDRAIYLDDYIAMDSVTVADWTPVATIIPTAGADAYVFHALSRAPHLSVYRRGTFPARWHYNDSPRITPVTAVADEGWKITTHARAATSRPADWGGDHGYDNQLVSMGAVFVAAGPAFRRGIVVPPFQNIHLYALMAHILGLTPVQTDGSLDSVREMLRDPR